MILILSTWFKLVSAEVLLKDVKITFLFPVTKRGVIISGENINLTE